MQKSMLDYVTIRAESLDHFSHLCIFFAILVSKLICIAAAVMLVITL